MSKKKFSEGLEDLLKDLDAFEAENELFSGRAAGVRKSSSKSFTEDLNVIFEEPDETDSSPETPKPSASLAGKSKSKEAHSMHARPSGLDALIRRTIDVKDLSEELQNSRKRITIALDREQLDQLKAIARKENAYLKDIMARLVDNYISDYLNNKGSDF